MMPMKQITFNAPLNHKAYSYEPMQIEVEMMDETNDIEKEESHDMSM